MSTISDVARIAGVSPMTVSNVLNGRSTVRAENRRKVEAAIRATGYVRNESARMLKAGRSRIVGLAVLEAVNPFYGEFAAGTESVLEAHGFSIFITSTHDLPDREETTLQLFAEMRCVGVVLTSTQFTERLRDAIARARNAGLSVITLANSSDGVEGCTVGGDDLFGGRLAAQHLLDVDRKTFAYVGGPQNAVVYQRRKGGYLDTLHKAGHQVQAGLAMDCPQDTIDAGVHAGEHLLSGPDRPDAVFCANDLLALGVLQAATRLGVRIPEDLAVVGYDDIPFAAGAAIPLTSIGEPIREMGRSAAELLLQESDTSPEHTHRHELFQPRLIARTSTIGVTASPDFRGRI